MAVSSTKTEDGGLLVAWQAMLLVIRWWVLCLHPLRTRQLLDQSFGLSIRNFQVGLHLFAARFSKMTHLLVSCKPTVSRDPMDSNLAKL